MRPQQHRTTALPPLHRGRLTDTIPSRTAIDFKSFRRLERWRNSVNSAARNVEFEMNRGSHLNRPANSKEQGTAPWHPCSRPPALFLSGVVYAILYNAFMNAINYSTVRRGLAGIMDQVCEDHEPVVITRNGERAVVMLSLDDFKSMEETAFLLRSPANAKRLLAAVKSLESGKGKARKLVE